MPRSLRSAERPLQATLQAVPSKSETHRALVAAALAGGASSVLSPLDAEDTQVTCAGLRALGVAIECDSNEWRVQGSGGRLPGAGRIDLRESGTSLRLLTAVATLAAEPSYLDGTPRLRERPIAPLVELLAGQGASLHPATGGGLPLKVSGPPPRGGSMTVPSGQTSQFASALMLIGPQLEGGLDLHLEPPAVSLPYLELTAAVMQAFGAPITRVGELHWRVDPGGYRASRFEVGGDHSSASYLLAAPLIAGGRLRMDRIDPASKQADACLGTILERLGARVVRGERSIEVQAGGALPPFDLSLGHAPDLVPTIAVLAAFGSGTSTIREVGHLRLKESDRLELMAHNLTAIGCSTRVTDDGLSIEAGRGTLHGGRIRTGGDHRIAMAFALAGLGVEGIELDDPHCVAKSYPGFWADWNSMLGEPS